MILFSPDWLGVGRFLLDLRFGFRFHIRLFLEKVVEGDEHLGDGYLMLGEAEDLKDLQEAEEVVDKGGQHNEANDKFENHIT